MIWDLLYRQLRRQVSRRGGNYTPPPLPGVYYYDWAVLVRRVGLSLELTLLEKMTTDNDRRGESKGGEKEREQRAEREICKTQTHTCAV